jgi:hypothetical protein
MEPEVGVTRSEFREEMAELRGEMRAGFERVGNEIAGVRGEMHAGFGRVDNEISGVRGEMHAGFRRVDNELSEVRGEMHAGFERVDGRIDGLQTTLIRIGGGVIVGLVGVIGAVLTAVVARGL